MPSDLVDGNSSRSRQRKTTYIFETLATCRSPQHLLLLTSRHSAGSLVLQPLAAQRLIAQLSHREGSMANAHVMRVPRMPGFHPPIPSRMHLSLTAHHFSWSDCLKKLLSLPDSWEDLSDHAPAHHTQKALHA